MGVAAVNVWDRFWFGDVPRARCQLLIIALATMVALDCWINLLPHAALHGLTDFHVAHLAALDLVPPQPSLYAAVQIAVGLLLLVGLWSPYRRVIHLVAALLFTYGWMMSRLDSYQHHYFLSLALLCVAWLDPSSSRRHPFKLLGLVIAIVYLFTAVAKMEPIWISGVVLKRLGEQQFWPESVVGVLRACGLQGDAAWSFLAVGGIVDELLLALGYGLATIWPAARRRGALAASCGMLLLALMTHAVIETLDVKIGWFSYYMMLLAVVFFLPAPWLERLADGLARRLPSRAGTSARHALGAGCGVLLLAVTLAMSPALVEYRLLRASAYLEKGRGQEALDVLASMSWLDRFQGRATQVRLQHVRLAAQRRLGNHEEATQLVAALSALAPLPADVRLEIAAYHVARQVCATAAVEYKTILTQDADHVAARAELALLHFQQGQLQDAEVHLRRVLTTNAYHREANYHLGVLLVLTDRAAEASKHLTRVLELAPEHAESRYYLAVSYDVAGETTRAGEEYQLALSYNPQLHEARLNLAKLMLEGGERAGAVAHLKQIPPQASCYREAKMLLLDEP